MAFVLDASVIGNWCFPDEGHSRALAAYDRIIEEPAIVPAHWWFEARNLLLMGERRKRITEGEVIAFLRRLKELSIKIDPVPDEEVVFMLARRHRLTIYDAGYLEVAYRENIALATLDAALATAARAENIPLVGDSF